MWSFSLAALFCIVLLLNQASWFCVSKTSDCEFVDLLELYWLQICISYRYLSNDYFLKVSSKSVQWFVRYLEVRTDKHTQAKTFLLLLPHWLLAIKRKWESVNSVHWYSTSINVNYCCKERKIIEAASKCCNQEMDWWCKILWLHIRWAEKRNWPTLKRFTFPNTAKLNCLLHILSGK